MCGKDTNKFSPDDDGKFRCFDCYIKWIESGVLLFPDEKIELILSEKK